MTPTRFKFLWRPRSKTRARLQGRLFAIQLGSMVNADTQSIVIERTITIDVRKVLPLSLFAITLAYLGMVVMLHRWMDHNSASPVTWSDCLLAPLRYQVFKASLQPDPPTIVPDQPQPASNRSPTMADSVLTSTRSRLDTIDNETAFFARLETNVKAGNDSDILSDLALAKRRSPAWFPARQTELAQLEISIDARSDDILALRGAASDYLNGNADRARVVITAAQKLRDEKHDDDAIALVEEVRRKTPGYQPAIDLLADWMHPAITTNPGAATPAKSAP